MAPEAAVGVQTMMRSTGSAAWSATTDYFAFEHAPRLSAAWNVVAAHWRPPSYKCYLLERAGASECGSFDTVLSNVETPSRNVAYWTDTSTISTTRFKTRTTVAYNLNPSCNEGNAVYEYVGVLNSVAQATRALSVGAGLEIDVAPGRLTKTFVAPTSTSIDALGLSLDCVSQRFAQGESSDAELAFVAIARENGKDVCRFFGAAGGGTGAANAANLRTPAFAIVHPWSLRREFTLAAQSRGAPPFKQCKALSDTSVIVPFVQHDGSFDSCALACADKPIFVLKPGVCECHSTCSEVIDAPPGVAYASIFERAGTGALTRGAVDSTLRRLMQDDAYDFMNLLTSVPPPHADSKLYGAVPLATRDVSNAGNDGGALRLCTLLCLTLRGVGCTAITLARSTGATSRCHLFAANKRAYVAESAFMTMRPTICAREEIAIRYQGTASTETCGALCIAAQALYMTHFGNGDCECAFRCSSATRLAYRGSEAFQLYKFMDNVAVVGPYTAMATPNRFCASGVKRRHVGIELSLGCAARCFPAQYMVFWGDRTCDCVDACSDWKVIDTAASAAAAASAPVARYEIGRRVVEVNLRLGPTHTDSGPYIKIDSAYCTDGVTRHSGLGSVIMKCAMTCFPLRYMVLWDDGDCDCVAKCSGTWKSHKSVSNRFELRAAPSAPLAKASTVVPMYNKIREGYACASSTTPSITTLPLTGESSQDACLRGCAGHRYVTFVAPKCYCAHMCFGASLKAQSGAILYETVAHSVLDPSTPLVHMHTGRSVSPLSSADAPFVYCAPNGDTFAAFEGPYTKEQCDVKCGYARYAVLRPTRCECAEECHLRLHMTSIAFITIYERSLVPSTNEIKTLPAEVPSKDFTSYEVGSLATHMDARFGVYECAPPCRRGVRVDALNLAIWPGMQSAPRANVTADSLLRLCATECDAFDSCAGFRVTENRLVCDLLVPFRPMGWRSLDIMKSGWVKSAVSQHCGAACKAVKKTCNSAKQSELTSDSLVRDAFASIGVTCSPSKDGSRAYAGAPMLYPSAGSTSSGTCFPLSVGATSSCSAVKWAGMYQLCWCDPPFSSPSPPSLPPPAMPASYEVSKLSSSGAPFNECNGEMSKGYKRGPVAANNNQAACTQACLPLRYMILSKTSCECASVCMVQRYKGSDKSARRIYERTFLPIEHAMLRISLNSTRFTDQTWTYIVRARTATLFEYIGVRGRACAGTRHLDTFVLQPYGDSVRQCERSCLNYDGANCGAFAIDSKQGCLLFTPCVDPLESAYIKQASLFLPSTARFFRERGTISAFSQTSPLRSVACAAAPLMEPTGWHWGAGNGRATSPLLDRCAQLCLANARPMAKKYSGCVGFTVTPREGGCRLYADCIKGGHVALASDAGRAVSYALGV